MILLRFVACPRLPVFTAIYAKIADSLRSFSLASTGAKVVHDFSRHGVAGVKASNLRAAVICEAFPSSPYGGPAAEVAYYIRKRPASRGSRLGRCLTDLLIVQKDAMPFLRSESRVPTVAVRFLLGL